VHGLAQLDTHDNRRLDLVMMRVVDEPAGLTIGDLLLRIREAGATWPELRARAAAAGWRLDPEQPDTDAFAVEEIVCVRVGEAVPRLVPSLLVDPSLVDGIGEVQYTVDLAALLPYSSGASLAEIAAQVTQ
jgi:hypothetical protein